jgi:3-oxoacyl-[acyl-carrier protein] reductase
MKIIIVTGDSRGLGFEIVNLLLKQGDYFVIGISKTATSEVIELLNKNPTTYYHINFDFSHPESIKKLYLDSIKKFGPISGLINNAAIAYDDILTNVQLEPLERMFRINVYSPIILTKYIIRDMILNNIQGSIVHISSVSAHTGYKGLSMYSATKGALESFSRTLAREWGSQGIRSNCIAPGFMETGMSSQLSLIQKDRIYKRTSLKKPTDTESVAEMALFLLSEKSCSITGSVFSVDNGTI